MIARYGVTGAAASGTNKTFLEIHSDGNVRAAVYDAIFSSVSTPADAAIRILIMRTSADGTPGGAVVPALLDLADAASEIVAGEGVFSVEPTYTAATELVDNSFNQRSIFRFVAVPGGELIIPATADAGIGFKSASVSTGTPQVEVTTHWQE